MRITIATLAVLIATCVTGAATVPDFPFVFARGEADVALPPDTATISFRAQAFHSNASNAVAEVRSRSVQVINFLGQQGFGKGALISYELDKRTIRDRKDNGEEKIIGYEVARLFTLSLDDLSKYETIAKTLFHTDGLIDIQTRFLRKDLKKIEADLLAEACANAKRSAEAMAKGFEGELGPVHCISKADFGGISGVFGLGVDEPMRDGFCMMADPGKDDLLFLPSTIKFANSVFVIFKLKDKGHPARDVEGARR